MAGRKGPISDEELENHEDALSVLVGDEPTTDDGNVDETDSGATEEANAAKPAQGAQKTDKGEQQPNASGNQPQRGRDDKSKQNGQQQAQQKPNNGNLPHLSEPQQRQVYEAVRARLQPVFNKLEMDNRQLKEQLTQYEATAKFAQANGMEPKEQLNAFQLYKQLQADPNKTINYLIDKAQAAGHNITVGGNQAGMTPQAIAAMIKEQLSPLTTEANDKQAWQEAQAEGHAEVQRFYAKHPDAPAQEQALSAIIERSPDKSLEEAYYELRMLYMRNNLDWNVPLHVYAAAASKNGGNLPPNFSPNNQDTRSVDTGPAISTRSAARPATPNPAELDADYIAPASKSRKDIIKDAMAAAGMDVSVLANR